MVEGLAMIAGSVSVTVSAASLAVLLVSAVAVCLAARHNVPHGLAWRGFSQCCSEIRRTG